MMLLVLLLVSLSSAKPRYLWGDALRDDPSLADAGGALYPRDLIERMYRDGEFGGSHRRLARGRSLFPPTLDPAAVADLLMRSQQHQPDRHQHSRSMAPDAEMLQSLSGLASTRTAASAGAPRSTSGRSINATASCGPAPPAQLCPTKFNTTAPMWGTSLTSGERVTIVQRFPDLLQQVIFHECTSTTCDVIHGACRQTYTPYLFLVLPLGPVTLTGQDYVMVESGCACQPKYSTGRPYEGPAPEYFG